MMRSPIDMFADLEAGIRDVTVIAVACRNGAVEPEAVDAVSDELILAIGRTAEAYAELVEHEAALSDIRSLLEFTFGGDVQ